ncbi:hypothetical protein A1507_11995 [Methylomonas koyamae]|uniref:Flagellar transcriptional regulator FlhD n=1 Tax=Methylomonas koyamae TaxID=702114 RepID=A0A177NEL3_9GAMM|nr:flagellar transcriptional regulator FlhD [Methylomonas koyamae]OAI16272.1 hypothetical protein A1507_11995 [Methylomonas koyamae]
MTEAIEELNLKILLFIREAMLNDQSSKVRILLGLDQETAQLIKSISIDELISVAKSGFFLFSPRFRCDEFKKILKSNVLDPKTLIEMLNRNG